MMFSGTFGSWLRQQRKIRDWTQAQLADRVGCSPVLMRKIEANERHPSQQIATLLANLFDIPAGERAPFVAYARGVTADDAVPPNNLPSDRSPFIGRETEIEQIQKRLVSPECRLLVVAGPGGIGKTRLALEVAQRCSQAYGKLFRDGVRFVPLQPVNSVDFIVSAIAAALGFQFFESDKPEEQLINYVRDKSYLLILDNFEHLLEGTSLISSILDAAPGLKLLVTSRQALNLQEEWLYLLQGMSLPQSAKNLESYDAVRMFSHHARRLWTDFSLADQADGVLRICTLTQGMPLALELAANRVRVLLCSEIADELENGLEILATPALNVPARHRNMRVVLDYSWEQLSDVQRSTLKMLSVFRGGVTRDAAGTVADASLYTLSALVDKSWLRRDAVQRRYHVHELLRQYAEERLRENTDEWRQANDRHCQYYATGLAQQRQNLRGNSEKETYAVIENELENVRSCWAWAVAHQKTVEMGTAMDALWLFYDTGNRYREGHEAFASAARMLRDNIASPGHRLLLGKVLTFLGTLTSAVDRFEEALQLLRESRSILAEFDAPADMAFCLYRLAMCMSHMPVLTNECLEVSEASLALYRNLGDLAGMSEGFYTLALLYEHTFKNVPYAIELAQQGLTAASQAGDRRGVATGNLRLASLFLAQSDYALSFRYARESLMRFDESGIVWGRVIASTLLGWAACETGDFELARLSACQALVLASRYQMGRFALMALVLVAVIFGKAGAPGKAVELLAMVEENSQKMKFVHSGASENLTKFESQLSRDDYLSAIQRGRSKDYEAAVRTIIHSLEQQWQAD